VMQVSSPRHKAVHNRIRTPTNTLPTMKHRYAFLFNLIITRGATNAT
jgi:hypothetical protein